MMTIPRSVRIMIVEDDRAIGEVLRNVVDEVLGWEATVACDGQDALRAVHTQPVDVLLIDVNLPDTSGPQLLERIRLQPGMADAPAVFMSAAGLSAAVQTALRQGRATAFVAKPFDLDDVVDLLETVAQPASRSASRAVPQALPQSASRRRRQEPGIMPTVAA